MSEKPLRFVAFIRYWTDAITEAREKYDFVMFIVTLILLISGLVLVSGGVQFSVFDQSAMKLGRFCLWGCGLSLTGWCLLWWPFKRHEQLALEKAELEKRLDGNDSAKANLLKLQDLAGRGWRLFARAQNAFYGVVPSLDEQTEWIRSVGAALGEFKPELVYRFRVTTDVPPPPDLSAGVPLVEDGKAAVYFLWPRIHRLQQILFELDGIGN